MPTTYTNPVYPYRRPAELDHQDVRHCPVVIVGGGPTGLAAAIDLAQQGIDSLVLDDNNTVSVGSRAICFAKRTLEVMDRLGAAQPMLDKGVTWQLGKVFFQERQVYEFNLLPEEGHRVPAFINLQQYYFEEYLVNRAKELEEHIDLRWKHKVTAVDSQPERTLLTVATEDGDYRLSCDYLLVADGANSRIRTMLGLESKGQIFQDRFLIADVIMKADFPTERWFWFDPPFHPNQSVLLHKQPDNVWRIDFQLGWDADPEEEKKEENIRPRVQALLATYDTERQHGAAENILNSTRATDFITPKSRVSRLFRDTALELAEHYPFARSLVNSGRLSMPCRYDGSPLNGPDAEGLPAELRPGSPAKDAPIRLDGGDAWLLSQLGNRFVLLLDGRLDADRADELRPLLERRADLDPLIVGRVDVKSTEALAGLPRARVVEDAAGLVADRYGLTAGAGYLIRPDQHVSARWAAPSAAEVATAMDRALGADLAANLDTRLDADLDTPGGPHVTA